MFPQNLTLDKVMEAIEGHDEFIVLKNHDYIVVDYLFTEKDSFDNSIRRECRGIKFKPDGTLLARPFQKFFNWGEKPELQQFSFSDNHSIYYKLDGSMVHPAIINDELVLMTRKGITEVSKEAMYVLYPDIKKFCLNRLMQGITPIFEYIGSIKHKVILNYNQPELIWLASRDNVTGEYIDDSKLIKDSVGLFEQQKITNIDNFCSQVKNLTDMEGVVIRWDDGNMVKIKTDDYVLMHRAKDLITREKDVAAIILNGTFDDFLGTLDEKHQSIANHYYGELMDHVNEQKKELNDWMQENRFVIRKEFAQRVRDDLPKYLWGCAFAIYDGESVFNATKKAFLFHTASSTRWEDFKKLAKIDADIQDCFIRYQDLFS